LWSLPCLPMSKCVAVCCSVLAVYCSILQCVSVCFGLFQCVVVCCSVWQCIEMRYIVLRSVLQYVVVHCSVLQCVAFYGSVWQCAIVCCCMLYCVASWCSVLQHVAESCFAVSKETALCNTPEMCCRVLICVALSCRVHLDNTNSISPPNITDLSSQTKVRTQWIIWISPTQ